jgi:hypothetical protein
MKFHDRPKACLLPHLLLHSINGVKMHLKPYGIFSRQMWQKFLDQDNKTANKCYSFWKERNSFENCDFINVEVRRKHGFILEVKMSKKVVVKLLRNHCLVFKCHVWTKIRGKSVSVEDIKTAIIIETRAIKSFFLYYHTLMFIQPTGDLRVSCGPSPPSSS